MVAEDGRAAPAWEWKEGDVVKLSGFVYKIVRLNPDGSATIKGLASAKQAGRIEVAASRLSEGVPMESRGWSKGFRPHRRWTGARDPRP